MTRARTNRIAKIAKTIAGFRSELLRMRLDEIHERAFMTGNEELLAKRASSKEHITEIKTATDFFADGLKKLGY